MALAATINKKLAYTPYAAPTTPPPGTYDPALDAAVRASGRGYGNLLQDTQDANARGRDELGYTEAGLTRTRDRGVADLTLGRDRGVADYTKQGLRLNEDTMTGQRNITQGWQDSNLDLQTQQQREGQDYATATGNLGRSYQALGKSQTGATVAAGAGSGTLAASLKARMANQGLDQGVLDQGHARNTTDLQSALDRGVRNKDQALGDLWQGNARGTEDIGQGISRLNEDTQLGITRTNEDYGTDPLGAIGGARRQYQYGVDDGAKAVQQAGIEHVNFAGVDTPAQKWAQAGQAGFVAPQRGQPGGPASNEFSDGQGSYKLVVKGGKRFKLRPNGQMVAA